MTYSTEHPRAAWGKVMREALKRPGSSGLVAMSFATAHFAGAALTGDPFLVQWGCAWAMMGATHFGLHAKSIINPGAADKASELPCSIRSQKPPMSWKQVVSEIAGHPVKSGAIECGSGTAAFGAGVVTSNPYLLGVGGSLILHGVKRMGNHLAGIRFPELVAK